MRILFYRDNNKPPAMPGEPVSFSFKENTSYDKMMWICQPHQNTKEVVQWTIIV